MENIHSGQERGAKDRRGELRTGGWTARFIGTKEEVKELCKNVCKTIVELSNNYNVYLDYEEVE